MTSKSDDLLYEVAHRNSMLHREEIENSKFCGCFYCLRIFDIIRIIEWIDKKDDPRGETAICPFCGMDTIVGDASGYEIDRNFLLQMHNFWFN